MAVPARSSRVPEAAQRASRQAWLVGPVVAVAIVLAVAAGRSGRAAGSVGPPPPQVAAIPLTPDAVVEFVEAHNAWRARVGVLPLRWSAELAAAARRWAVTLARRGCRLSHEAREDGENLFFAGPLRAAGREAVARSLTPREIVDAWGGESEDYSYARNACARGRQCGHYVQIVWSATREVGCAGAICADRGQVWVCRYRPGSISGRLPY